LGFLADGLGDVLGLRHGGLDERKELSELLDGRGTLGVFDGSLGLGDLVLQSLKLVVELRGS
jgi:hypothetical protein